MLFSSSVEIADEVAQSILKNVAYKLKQKQIGEISKKQAAKDVIILQKQFINFISDNLDDNQIKVEHCPRPIDKDSFSKISTRIVEGKSPHSINPSTRRSNNLRKQSIPKSRSGNESTSKNPIINRDKLQNFIKLQEQTRQQCNQLESKLRKYYISTIQTQQRQAYEAEKRLKLQTQKLQKNKNKLSERDRTITHDYEGKIINFSPNTKLQSILTLLRIGNKHILKTIQKKKVQTQTLDMSQYQSINSRNRKYSTIMRETRDKQIEIQRERGQSQTIRHSLHNASCSPLFQKVTPSNNKNMPSLKLSQYRIQNRKYKSIQGLNITTRNSNRFRQDLEASKFINTMPSRNKTQTSKNEERLKTQLLSSNLPRPYRLHQNILGSTPDIIYYNPELYSSLIK